MTGERVFSVSGSEAQAARPISLAEAGLTERAHLQEWVLAHPEILGDGIMIITSEFDGWRSAGGPERDRLDVLGLEVSGRLVVAELKRDRAPDTVEMQAIKYAAMASRFTPEVLASQHADWLRKTGNAITEEEAMARLVQHVEEDLDSEVLRRPRIVLVATEFSPTVTSAVVWLNEMGVDIALIRVQAYATESETIITASQLYPVPDTEAFTVAPIRASARAASGNDYPRLVWDEESLTRLHEIASNPTVRAVMDLCAQKPGQWVSLREVEAAAGRTPPEARGDLAGLTMTIKRRLGRSNWPIEHGTPDEKQFVLSYRMDPELAEIWRSLGTSDQPS